MSTATESAAERHAVSASTLRMRRYRERRREALCLLKVELPEANIDNAISRQLLKPEDRAEPWAVIQACYAAELSDAALDWLIKGGVITGEQRGDGVAILRAISDWLERATT